MALTLVNVLALVTCGALSVMVLSSLEVKAASCPLLRAWVLFTSQSTLHRYGYAPRLELFRHRLQERTPSNFRHRCASCLHVRDSASCTHIGKHLLAMLCCSVLLCSAQLISGLASVVCASEHVLFRPAVSAGSAMFKQMWTIPGHRLCWSVCITQKQRRTGWCAGHVSWTSHV